MYRHGLILFLHWLQLSHPLTSPNEQSAVHEEINKHSEICDVRINWIHERYCILLWSVKSTVLVASLAAVRSVSLM